MEYSTDSAVCLNADVLIAVALDAVLVPVIDLFDSNLAGSLGCLDCSVR
jgi:hypothetical protein